MYAGANPIRYIDLTGLAFTEAEKREIFAGVARRTGGLNDTANQIAAPIAQRLEGVSNLVVPVSYLRDRKGEGASFTRRVQYWLLDQVTDRSNSAVTRGVAGVAALAMQPGAALNDIAHALAEVPSRLGGAGTDIREAFQAESATAALFEATEAVEKVATAGEVTIGSFLLVRGGRSANARMVEEGRVAGRPEAVPAEGKSPPIDNYDAAAWRDYYRADPGIPRSVGAAGARGGRGPIRKGKIGVAKSKAEAAAAGETLVGEEVTFELPSGRRTRSDLVLMTEEGLKIRESKEGPSARMTTPQRQMREAARQGEEVIPRGKKASEAGLLPGKKLRVGEFEEDRF